MNKIIQAFDENGNIFEKEIEFKESANGRCSISIGGYAYALEDMIDFSHKEEGSTLCIDFMGRNHKQSPVYVNNSDIYDFLKDISSISF